jgi:hypothetical protein
MSRKIPLLLLVGGLTIVLLWTAISALRVWQATQSLLSRQSEVEELVSSGLTQVDADEAEVLLSGIRADVVELSSAAGPFVQLAPLFGWLPRIGPMLAEAPELMEIADASTEAAVHGMRGLKPALLLLHEDRAAATSLMPDMVRVFDSAGEELALSSAALSRAAEARRKISDTSQLPWRVQTLLLQLDESLPLAEDGLKLATVLPELMGADGQRTYLIVAQNEDELRPTGGFASGAGLLVLDQGEIQSLSFLSSDVVDDWQNKPYDLPPQPFQDFMGMDIFLFRDANFWPHFPTSARELMALYAYGQDIELDGVIAVDQHFLGSLLEVVGPLDIPELAATLSATNFISEMRAAWEPAGDEENWIAERKSFMAPLAVALFEKLTSELGSLDLVWLARVVGDSVEQRHLQAYVRDPASQQILVQIGWAGEQVNPPGQDFLLVADTNMGFNKVNASVVRSLDYRVVLDDDGGGIATLTVEYNHLSEPNGQVCEPFAVSYSRETQYSDLIEDCYWNFLRVYVPEGSTLIEATRHPVAGEMLLTGQDWDGYARSKNNAATGLTEFSQFILLQHGERATATFTYKLPQTITRAENGMRTYHLAVNKQAGVNSQSLAVTIEPPPGAKLASVKPEPDAVTNKSASFAAEQQTDLSFSVAYEPMR